MTAPANWHDRQRSTWMTRTRSQYGGSTFKGRKFFTLEEYRAWVKVTFGLSWERRCFYCEAIITIANFRPDHVMPLGRGGPNTLTNLVPCCAPCNAAKGKLTAKEFIALLNGLRTFAPAAQADILGRLKKASSAAPGLRHLMLQRLKARKKQNGNSDPNAAPPAV